MGGVSNHHVVSLPRKSSLELKLPFPLLPSPYLTIGYALKNPTIGLPVGRAQTLAPPRTAHSTRSSSAYSQKGPAPHRHLTNPSPTPHQRVPGEPTKAGRPWDHTHTKRRSKQTDITTCHFGSYGDADSLFSCSLSLSPSLSHHQAPGDEPPMIIQSREPINQQHHNQQCREGKKAHNLPRVPRCLSSAHGHSNLYSSTQKMKKRKSAFTPYTDVSECILHCTVNVADVKSVSAPRSACCDLWARTLCEVEICIKTALWWI